MGKGNKRRPGTTWGRKGAPPERKAEVVAYVEAGHSIRETSAKFGHSGSAIASWLTQAGRALPGPAGGNRTAGEWAQIIEEWQASGLTQKAYASQLGVSFKAFNAAITRHKLRAATKPGGEQLALPVGEPRPAPRRPAPNGHASPPRVIEYERNPGDYGDVGAAPGPSSHQALEDALREAIRERQALRTTLDIFQRENEALRRRIGFGGGQ